MYRLTMDFGSSECLKEGTDLSECSKRQCTASVWYRSWLKEPKNIILTKHRCQEWGMSSFQWRNYQTMIQKDVSVSCLQYIFKSEPLTLFSLVWRLHCENHPLQRCTGLKKHGTRFALALLSYIISLLVIPFPFRIIDFAMVLTWPVFFDVLQRFRYSIS